MAEPDYLEGDCDELIKPKKLINPVKNSRNHQDLHRELLMNQKRSDPPMGGTAVLLSRCFRRIFYFHLDKPAAPLLLPSNWSNRLHAACTAAVLCHACVFTNPLPPHTATATATAELYKPLDMKLSYKRLYKASSALGCQILVM